MVCGRANVTGKQEGRLVSTAIAIVARAGSELGPRRCRKPVRQRAYRRGGRQKRGKLDSQREGVRRALADAIVRSTAGPPTDLTGALDLKPGAWGFE
jgi:hypothetical protein